MAEVAGEAVELSALLAVEAGEGAIAAAVANPADGSMPPHSPTPLPIPSVPISALSKQM